MSIFIWKESANLLNNLTEEYQKLLTQEEGQKFLDYLVTTIWFKSRFPNVIKCELKIHNGTIELYRDYFYCNKDLLCSGLSQLFSKNNNKIVTKINL